MTEFAPAVRTNTAIVLALAGASGSGKTKTALLLATGLAGDGHIIIKDSEGNRALHYAPRPGEKPDFVDTFLFAHESWEAPYTPAALGEFLKRAQHQYSVVIVDSMSDEHEGEGGLCDMAAAEYEKQAGTKNSAAAWARPKAEHKLHIVRWLRQARCHVIFCLRADEKVEFQLVAGKTKVVPLDWTPIAEKRLLYDVTTSLLFTPDRPGIPKPIKLYDKHAPFFPPDRQVSREAGKRLAEWASGTAPLRAVEVDAQSDASPLGETDDRLKLQRDLNGMAEAKAKQGGNAFRDWWKDNLSYSERQLIRGFLSRYQRMAQEADEAAA